MTVDDGHTWYEAAFTSVDVDGVRPERSHAAIVSFHFASAAIGSVMTGAAQSFDLPLQAPGRHAPSKEAR